MNEVLVSQSIIVGRNLKGGDFYRFFVPAQYQNQRGGRIVLQAVAAPAQQEWGSALDGLQAALDLEQQVNQVIMAPTLQFWDARKFYFNIECNCRFLHANFFAG